MKRTWIITGIGVVLGAIGGWLYWHYVGCSSGSCAITSSPVNSTLYGAAMFGLLVNTFGPRKERPKAPDTTTGPRG